MPAFACASKYSVGLHDIRWIWTGHIVALCWSVDKLSNEVLASNNGFGLSIQFCMIGWCTVIIKLRHTWIIALHIESKVYSIPHENSQGAESKNCIIIMYLCKY